jgi:hypothetical protein
VRTARERSHFSLQKAGDGAPIWPQLAGDPGLAVTAFGKHSDAAGEQAVTGDEVCGLGACFHWTQSVLPRDPRLPGPILPNPPWSSKGRRTLNRSLRSSRED